MADLNVTIFTFNDNEADAVDYLLDLYLGGTKATAGVWSVPRRHSDTIIGTLNPSGPAPMTVAIRHKPLRAQGNVTAGAELARTAFEDPDARDPADDYYIYYACCGALDGRLIGKGFRVSDVAYISLGSVKPRGGGGEVAKLKNKWFVYTQPYYQKPLSSFTFRTGTKAAPGRLKFLKIKPAYVLATDKVIQVPPAKKAPPPSPYGSSLAATVYPDAEWTYGKAMAHSRDHLPDKNILIDMETFGVASTAHAMGLQDRVLVLRVVTDALTNKDSKTIPNQRTILMNNAVTVLHRALSTIMGIP